MRTVLPKPALQRAATWSSELQLLNSLLNRDPADTQAWRWRIQARILSFLIARYGGEPVSDSDPPENVTSLLTTEVSLPVRTDRSLRSYSAIRRFVERIAEANRRRRG